VTVHQLAAFKAPRFAHEFQRRFRHSNPSISMARNIKLAPGRSGA
jgi:hypothetical protein